VINLWPVDALGIYPQTAYATAWMWALGLQIMALIWCLYHAILGKLR
jgi:hypothetical protein